MIIREYKGGDINFIKSRNGDTIIDNAAFDVMAVASRARSIYKGEKLVAILTMTELWKGVTQVGAVISDDARGYGVELTKACRKEFVLGLESFNAHRCHIMVSVEKREYVRWAKLIGFSVESVMERAGTDGEDILIMAWLRPVPKQQLKVA